jgi:glycosyltransferase involved in cell wall biosynthesis
MKEIAENAAILIDDPEDDSAILSELNRITEDGDLKNDLIVAGRERAKKYTVKNMAIKMLSLYSRLIG